MSFFRSSDQSNIPINTVLSGIVLASSIRSSGSTGSPDGLEARSLGFRLLITRRISRYIWLVFHSLSILRIRYILFSFLAGFGDFGYSSTSSSALMPLDSGPANSRPKEKIVGSNTDARIVGSWKGAGLAEYDSNSVDTRIKNSSVVDGPRSVAMQRLHNKDRYIVDKSKGDIEHIGDVPAKEAVDQVDPPYSSPVNSDLRD
ncbi:hypothetical protein ACOSQ2_024282 [Xanthoceras sorbifolium]